MDSAKIQQLIKEKVFFPYQGMLPKVDDSVFIASGAKVIGNVEVGKDSSVWYNTVIRGDVNFIRIGELTNVQDCSMLHVTNETHPLLIGDKVTIGHSVTLHGCTVHNLCLIGMGAVVLDGAVVEENSVVAAGAVVPPNFVVPKGKLVAGVPCKIIRELTEQEIKDLGKSASRYLEYSHISRESLNKEL
ncbi:MAG: gamma carbonic anhydrase family protein [Ignavibacteriaceae bacterium]